MRKRILIVFGTRPEAIKMAPVIKAFLSSADHFETRVCITAQHREMLDQVLDFFEIVPDYDLDLMRPDQTLYGLTAEVITGIKPVLIEFKPDHVLVHGDTTTSMATALAAFYAQCNVCHIEAGLRTYNKMSPYPEEMNRQLTGRIADFHFTPTDQSFSNLISEGISREKIGVVGNTVIDSLVWAMQKLQDYQDDEIRMLKQLIDPGKRLILVTGHRRENFGAGFIGICNAIKQLSRRRDVQVIYPVHLNPAVQTTVSEMLSGLVEVALIAPLAYPAFVWLMSQSYLILTDSGGVQEEAPTLGKPVLVMRDTTERPEAVIAGTVKLVGTDPEKIVAETDRLLDDLNEYKRMSLSHNPYGDGKTALRVLKQLLHEQKV